MVHFEPKAEPDIKPAAAAATGAPAKRRGTLATVSYLPGAQASSSAGDVSEVDSGGVASGAVDTGDLDHAVDPDSEHAEQVLLQRLRGRSLSISEARGVLVGLDLPESEIEEIVERFIRLDYLDEAKLAEQIVYSQHERKGLGRSGVQAEMRRRGLDKELIAETLDAMPDDETERAIEVAIKRVQQLGRLDDRTIDRRLNAFLMRKGYPSSVVREAVQAALDSRNGGGSSGVRFQ
ncbi:MULTISPECIES: regulatory protein RecX [Cryobacterium]|uniref:Regulatory protein RecX n=1 Tax=Cryobacterium glucosi TaxID=1259175 RepID=A0ABY2IKN9_9MICO|nr:MULTISPECIES: regulatory protein RecX [Cryobacterium]MDY7527180.1 regulatory protein RecX [Cryobacterium sp. 10C2]MDY7557030.1 regulatory protein RecX [Cryobacterium sp. 10C3]MEB0002077.1 regulatory protein RecX [Cryobacterium sp. RTC2.1]MEB0200324.1 regulatory protein RecX [Cryobacterium sp. 5I3]MEB0286601.1 regulatory protein RecX [Cryobacterium sp. 10S3]